MAVTGRVSQGVRAINLRDGDSVQDAVAIPSMEDIEKDAAAAKQSMEGVAAIAVEEEDVATKTKKSKKDCHRLRMITSKNNQGFS